MVIGWTCYAGDKIMITSCLSALAFLALLLGFALACVGIVERQFAMMFAASFIILVAFYAINRVFLIREKND